MALTLLHDFLLIVMAYDFYMAICLSFHYTNIMCSQCCLLLVTTSWLCTNLLAFSPTLLMSQFSFCASLSILQFFCNFLPLLHLACSDIHIFQVMMFAKAALLRCCPSHLCPGLMPTSSTPSLESSLLGESTNSSLSVAVI